MKKKWETPFVEIVNLLIVDVLTVSDNLVDTTEDDTLVNPDDSFFG